jgi:hypothetical protein
MWRLRVGVGLSVLMTVAVGIAAAPPPSRAPRAPHAVIAWDDVPLTLRPLLEQRDLSSASFPAFITRVRSTTMARVREGQLDHVIFYALQSTHFTTLPPIEPALSAKALADSLDVDARARFRADPLSVSLSSIPKPVERRMAALLTALDDPKRSERSQRADADARLQLFGGVIETVFPDRRERRTGLLHAYVRAMRFLYEKEFEARAATANKSDVARLYQTRGLSTDTAVEAGFLMHLGLATMHALDASYRVRRALIVGPGLDLAPRTGLLEAAPPQSYQPWALADSLVSLGLSRLDDLQVTAADINPLVVDHVTAVSRVPPALVLLSGIPNDSRIALSDDYRDYFARFGRAIGQESLPPRVDAAHAAHLRKTVQVSAAAAHALRAEPLDVVTERLPERFDLVVITNVLPYLDDRELMLALANIAAMLEPGGVLLHNEPRPLVGEATTRVGLPLVHARNATIATVTGAPTPLADMVFIHRRTQPDAKD